MREKILQQYTRVVKQLITKEYKERFFNDSVEVTCFTEARKHYGYDK